jgi:hypothetical protein
VKSRNVTRTHQALKGLAAFARVVSAMSLDTCTAALRPTRLSSLERGEDRFHPGEGRA